MPTKRRPITRHASAPVTSAVEYLLRCGIPPDRDGDGEDLDGWFDALQMQSDLMNALWGREGVYGARRVWADVRARLMADCSRTGTRPAAWWCFEATHIDSEARRAIYAGMAAGNDTSAEQRALLAAHGAGPERQRARAN